MTHFTNQLSSLLPEETMPNVPFAEAKDSKRDELVAETVKIAQEKKSAQELMRLKLAAKRTLKNEARKEEAKSPVKPSPEKVEEAKAAIRMIESMEAQRAEPLKVENVVPTAIASGQAITPNMVQDALKLQGASRPDITRLLTALNINTSVRLTKHDTANLLACLLTCNEAQLQALMSNKKVPIAIKTVIKRLLNDSKVGDIDTIEKLWDRIFGKAGLVLDLPEQTQLQTGIIPNVPVSREAYILIRDTLI